VGYLKGGLYHLLVEPALDGRLTLLEEWGVLPRLHTPTVLLDPVLQKLLDLLICFPTIFQRAIIIVINVYCHFRFANFQLLSVWRIANDAVQLRLLK
jgi:hypothetical protein